MTLEDFFLKDYEKLKRKKEELEKNYELLKIETEQDRARLKEVVGFLKKGNPYDTGSKIGFLSLTYWLCGEEKEKAIKLLKKLGVEIEGTKEN